MHLSVDDRSTILGMWTDDTVVVLLLQFTTPGGTTLLQPNIFVTILGIASTVNYQAKHVCYNLSSACADWNVNPT